MKRREKKERERVRDKKEGEEKIVDEKQGEPVFILFFHSDYGRAFIKNAMNRKGTQLQDVKLYSENPRAQDLFQAVRWISGLIIRNTKQISKNVGWKWPPADFKDRIYRIRKLLKILRENNFINKPTEQGKTWKTKAWAFYVRKRKLIGQLKVK